MKKKINLGLGKYGFLVQTMLQNFLVIVFWVKLRSYRIWVDKVKDAITKLKHHQNKQYKPLVISKEVTFPFTTISFGPDSDLVSQKRILLSKWPLIIVDPEPSAVTRSLQLDPANFVSIPGTKK